MKLYESILGKSRKILVIDDQKSIHDDFIRTFALEKDTSGYNALESQIFGNDNAEKKNDIPYKFSIDSAYQGKDGLEMIKNAIDRNEPYHVAFVDMRMPPGWDGIETIRNIFKVDDKIQVVICTAFSDYGIEEIQQKLGHNDSLLILKKPFDRVEVIQLALNLSEKWFLKALANLKKKDMEKLIERKTRDIERFQSKLFQTSKMSALGAIALNLSHELFNPLCIIKSGHHLIETSLKDTPKEIQENFAIVNRHIARMVDVITKFKLAGDRQDCDLKPGDIMSPIKGAMEQLEELVQLQNVKFKIHAEEDEILYPCNQELLREVFVNIFNNSIDAMDMSSERMIDIYLEKLPSAIDIRIRDTGTGIPLEMRDKIFDPYFSTKDEEKSTGLGLSYVYSIVHAHNGEIFLEEYDENNFEKVDFVIRLPLGESVSSINNQIAA
ncbi:hybrid sensor histidine kinase/response regulator [Bacteriovoracaceae bacterium]|nr:hybrid sensor histidine kinase/response regulator [Bacteriovoracaceae bacterium]